jgi:hypothetical protein
MLENGVIRPSVDSPWNANVVLVTKKDGGIRYCVNYTALNKVTQDLAYDIPRTADVLDSFGGCSYFTTLDLASGYWAVPIKESDKAKTAFNTPLGSFEFNVAPFGLKNMPSFFSRMMDRLYSGHSKAVCWRVQKSLCEGWGALQMRAESSEIRLCDGLHR